jgi:hypothetical protein
VLIFTGCCSVRVPRFLPLDFLRCCRQFSLGRFSLSAVSAVVRSSAALTRRFLFPRRRSRPGVHFWLASVVCVLGILGIPCSRSTPVPTRTRIFFCVDSLSARPFWASHAEWPWSDFLVLPAGTWHSIFLWDCRCLLRVLDFQSAITARAKRLLSFVLPHHLPCSRLVAAMCFWFWVICFAVNCYRKSVLFLSYRIKKFEFS